VLRGQIDISARVIWLFEKIGAASRREVANRERLLAAKLAQADPRRRHPGRMAG
jgi:stearoyl-CoA desaturase (delta-9 desaturase)